MPITIEKIDNFLIDDIFNGIAEFFDEVFNYKIYELSLILTLITALNVIISSYCNENNVNMLLYGCCFFANVFILNSIHKNHKRAWGRVNIWRLIGRVPRLCFLSCTIYDFINSIIFPSYEHLSETIFLFAVTFANYIIITTPSPPRFFALMQSG